MSLFYFTFGQKYRHEPHPIRIPEQAHPDGYVTVEARDWETARAIMLYNYGIFWATQYEAAEFDSTKSLYPRGELLKLTLANCPTEYITRQKQIDEWEDSVKCNPPKRVI